jgi:catechol 2,3-dioxygenase-like lactoylglutathione lyase family enzyme
LGHTRGVLLFAIEHTSPPGSLPEAALASDEGAAVYALDHAVVQSRDADATRELYGDGLGLRLALDRSFEQWGARLLFFRVGGVTLEIGASTKQSADPDAADRFGGLAWKVPDADAAQRRLRSAGFDVTGVRDGYKPGTRVCTVRDAPGGVPTLVIQPTAPGA